jgi:hypothetical protein
MNPFTTEKTQTTHPNDLNTYTNPKPNPKPNPTKVTTVIRNIKTSIQGYQFKN